MNACKSALCPSFLLPPILHEVSSEHARGKIKSKDENRSYYCNECGQGSRLKSNVALVEEYSRPRTLNGGTYRERCPDPTCLSHGVPQKLMPSAYRSHGKTPKGDPRFQCKSCRKTFSIGSPKRRHRETKETGEIMRLLVNNVPLRRILEVSDVPADRLYHRIDFLARQCRDFSAQKDKKLWKSFSGRNRVLAFDVQTILANWRHAHRVLNVPIHHAVTVEKNTGYVVAATTDFDPNTEPIEIEREMYQVDDFELPRAWRLHGRVWACGEYRDSVLRGVNDVLSDEERVLSGNSFDLPGEGARVRGDISQAAHIMMVKKLVGSDYRQLLLCIDGDSGLARIANLLFAKEVISARAHIADVRFTKGLGNRKREKLVAEGDAIKQVDVAVYRALMDVAGATCGLETEDSGKKKADRQTPAMKIGTAKGLVYIRDVLSFS